LLQCKGPEGNFACGRPIRHKNYLDRLLILPVMLDDETSPVKGEATPVQ